MSGIVSFPISTIDQIEWRFANVNMIHSMSKNWDKGEKRKVNRENLEGKGKKQIVKSESRKANREN